MDIENLKLILETVNGVSGDVQTVAILWIVVDKIIPAACWMTGVLVLIYKAPAAFNAICGEREFFKYCRGELGLGDDGELYDYQKARVKKTILDMIKERKSLQKRGQ